MSFFQQDDQTASLPLTFPRLPWYDITMTSSPSPRPVSTRSSHEWLVWISSAVISKEEHAEICLWRNSAGQTLLHEAIYREWWDMVPVLVGLGIDVNATNREGDTAGHAMFDGAQDRAFVEAVDILCRLPAIECLLAAGWDPALENKARFSALEWWRDCLMRPEQEDIEGVSRARLELDRIVETHALQSTLATALPLPVAQSPRKVL